MSQGYSVSNWDGSIARLQYRINEYYDLLDIDGAFDCTDIEDTNTNKSILALLSDAGAIESVDKHRPDDRTSGGTINKWVWEEEHRKHLKEYWEQLDVFPDCGHRVNIYNSREVPEDKLSCRYCAEEGEYPEFDKEFVKSLL